MQRRLTWQQLEQSLTRAWREVSARGGSFADAPCEPGEDFDATLGPMFPLEKAAHNALDVWIASGSMPIMFPAANRYAGIKLICAIGLVRQLAEIPSMTLPAEWSADQALRWLLFDVHADTVQVALDNMRHDLLGGTMA
jgi:hypothetical protein